MLISYTSQSGGQPIYYRGPKMSCDFSHGPHPQLELKQRYVWCSPILFSSGGGGTRIWSYESDGGPFGERKQGEFGVGFRRKKGQCLWNPKKLETFDVNWVKFEWKFARISWRLTKVSICARKIWNFTFQFWKKKSLNVG